ncbi:MAG TPA: AAA family ATPase [Pyrinomonadaceae bacterium]|jgi:ATP-dependent Clp protease ATP-binding subunit ClpX|nr:AAA family ATPase [Pyrinomonadaceae bacterium]
MSHSTEGEEQDGNLFEEGLSPEQEAVREFVDELPLPAPPEIAEELERAGYKGQETQRRALSLMAYRHVRRLKRLHVEGTERRQLTPKQNFLLIGPTGCGKTFLVEMLFQHIFKLPTVIVDITSFTESGYIGDDVKTVVTRLIDAAHGDLLLASCGVVCLDEFDKIASSTSNARFAGQGTTKDVSGYGVQRELLAMLEGTDVLAPMDYGFSEYGYRAHFSTRDVPFIACGAFSGLDELLKEKRARIGFHGSAEEQLETLTIDEVATFQKFGFLPELIGRFARIVTFPALPFETLRRIMTDNILPQFVGEFDAEGLRLTVTDAAVEHVIARSIKRGTGARGLHVEMVAAVESAAFETFKRVRDAEVVIDVAGERLTSDIRRRA